MKHPRDTMKRCLDAVRRIGLNVGDCFILACCALLTAGFLLPAQPANLPLPDFADLEPDERKLEFFGYLSPIIADVNDRARADREFVETALEALGRGDEFSWFQRRRIEGLARRYEVELDEMPLDEALAVLERRTGAVPESLVLIQAAVESGWGTSRFAVEGNNLFGQRCYDPGCGIVPQRRRDGASFAVAEYDSVAESVSSYVRNLNTHPEYREFRILRDELREGDEPVTGLALVDGLDGYSERGDEYLDDLRAMIRQNGLE